MARFLLVAALFAVACSSRPNPTRAQTQQYALRGEVLSLDAKHKLARIKHEKIEGWMEAMTMDIPVREQTEFDKLKPGLRITATVYVREGDFEFWIGQIAVQSAP